MIGAQGQSSRRFARPRQRGFALMLAMVVTILVLALGLAMLEVSRIDQVRSERDLEAVQAVSAAELGLARARAMALSQKIAWIGMTYNGAYLSDYFDWTPGNDPLYHGHQVCTIPFSAGGAPTPVGGSTLATYRVVVEDLTGSAISSGTYRIHSFGTSGPFTRHVCIDAQTLTFGSFLWFSDNENGVYFTSGDYLDGWLYTNDRLYINRDPVFAQRAHSAASSVRYYNGGPPADNPQFMNGLVLNAPVIEMTTVFSGGQLNAIRAMARSSGGIWQGSNGGYPYRVTFSSNGTFMVEKSDRRGRWTTVINNQSVASTNGAFYFEDDVQVQGVLDGKVTLGTPDGHDITITDNLYYAYPASISQVFQSGFDPNDALFNDKLALISGGDVVIDKTWDNSWSDFYLTGVVVAPNGSIRNASYTSSPTKRLHLWGGFTQGTRGAVGQISHTGFLKDYHYDTRFLTSPPPYLPQIGYEFQAWSLDS